VPDLKRLFDPRSIAVVGGGAWCASIQKAAVQVGYEGQIFSVHPEAKPAGDLPVVRSLSDWDGPIDAAFIGVNRFATIDVVTELEGLKGGGAVCFASGFSEAQEELSDGQDVQGALLNAAVDMPVLGPNCYGFVNALDGVAIWPDQHGCTRVDRGVAILTQSSNIAINLSMQARGLPIGFIATCGNMAQTTQAQIALHLLDDDRITAIGMHIEGFADIAEWTALAAKAHDRNVPIIALKVGRSDQAKAATVSHTASLAGGDAGAQALLDRLGIARVDDLSTFLETLKLLHCNGRLSSNRLSSISCSGGEASLVADTAMAFDVSFPPLKATQKTALARALGPKVALANPLDYHTYIWRDAAAMSAAWGAMADEGIGLTMTVVDYPRTDASDWSCATEAAIAVRANSGRPVAVVASLSELMPEETAARLMANGVTPMQGLPEALAAAEAASKSISPVLEPVLTADLPDALVVLTEAEAKAEMAGFGLVSPGSAVAASVDDVAEIAADMRGPLVVKGLGIAHKSEAGAVRLGVDAVDAASAAADMPAKTFLIEEMIEGGVAELLVGVTLDPAHGYVLTLAAGGVLTELLQDSVSLLVPSTRDAVAEALTQLKAHALLTGFRGKPAADIASVIEAVMSIQAYVIANAGAVSEVEVNPLICTPTRAVAADALIRKAKA
jgi:acetyl-CoA synthetase